MKNLKNIKYLSIALILCGFAVSGTRGALTQDKSIASEVTNNPDAAVNESSVQSQKDINVKVSEQPAAPDIGATQKVIQNVAQLPESEKPKSEVVFASEDVKEDVKIDDNLDDNLDKDTAEKIAEKQSGAVENINIEEINIENGDSQAKKDLVTEPTEPVIDETQKTFAQEAEEKAEEKTVEESVVNKAVKKEITEEEMVLNPEENLEQSVAAKDDLEDESAVMNILGEEKDDEEKLLDDQGLNNYYIEEDDLSSETESEKSFEENDNAERLVG